MNSSANEKIARARMIRDQQRIALQNRMNAKKKSVPAQIQEPPQPPQDIPAQIQEAQPLRDVPAQIQEPPQPPQDIPAQAQQSPQVPAQPQPQELSLPIEPSSIYGNFQFFWINLERATERRTQLEEQLSSRKIRNTRVEAIDASKDNLTPYIPGNWKTAGPHKAEIATTISHLKAIYTFVQSNEPIGVICEDDTIFEYEPRWPYTLKQLIENAPSKWEILALSITLNDEREWKRLIAENKRYPLRKWGWFSAVCYAITRSHALSVCKNFGVAIDSPNFQCKLKGSYNRMQSEMNVISTGPHRFTVYPPAFTYPTDNTSYIHPNHVSGHANSKNIISRLVYNDEHFPVKKL